MAHLLSIEAPSISNSKVLRIFDTSIWDEELAITSRKLDIIPPGYKYSTQFNVSSGFDRLFNSSTLNISDAMTDLPDGIYIIRLTVNDDTWVEYNHLRQTCLLKKYMKARCALRLAPCDSLDIDLVAKARELDQIRWYYEAAVAQVEWCNAPSQGLELHNYAAKLLDKFSLEKCKTC
jgi:hypothetical protein